MKPMTVQEAIHIMSEEAVRCERLAKDLAESPLDNEGKALEHAKHYKQKARAMRTLINVGRAFEQVGQE